MNDQTVPTIELHLAQTLIESAYRSWAIGVAEKTPDGAAVVPTWEDVDKLIDDIQSAIAGEHEAFRPLSLSQFERPDLTKFPW